MFRNFGNFKRRVSSTPIWNLYDVARVCSDSSKSNFPILVGSHDGKVKVKVYSWFEKLRQYFTTIPDILTYHHFRMSRDSPGIVLCQRTLSDEPIAVDILRRGIEPSEISKDLPNEVPPSGFSLQGKKYLFNEIRQFCRAGTEDSVAPEPEEN